MQTKGVKKEEKWVGLTLAESVGGKGRLQHSTTRIWRTHGIFSSDIQMISEARLSAFQIYKPSNAATTKQQLAKTDFPVIFSFISHDKKKKKS